MTTPSVSKGIRLMTQNNLAVSSYALNTSPAGEIAALQEMTTAAKELASYILWLERRVPAAYQEYTT